MGNNTAVVDYGMGNLFSIKKLVDRLGFACTITSDKAEILNAQKVILPGVGHFGKAMHHLAEANLIDVLNEKALVQKSPILGICLGMQLMASFSEEGNVEGLSWFDAKVEKFTINNKELFKVPHVGWNTVTHEQRNSVLLKDVRPDDEFYFVHSYHLTSSVDENVLCYTNYEYKFISAIQRENIFGVQFHPEKSHGAGEQMIKNFLNQ